MTRNRWFALAFVLLAPCFAAISAWGQPAASDSVDLAPSSAPPWTPPRPLPEAEAWETVLRFPLRVATFPLHILDEAIDHTLRWVEATNLVTRTLLVIAALPTLGADVRPASLGDRTGLGIKLSARPDPLGNVIGAEVSASTRGYNRTGVDVGVGPVEVAYRSDWRPEDRFYGNGMDSDEDRPSTYALRTQRFLASLEFPWAREQEPRSQVRVWAGPRESILRRGRENPSFHLVYPEESALLDRRQEHFTYGLSMVADRRSGTPHWSRGWRLSGQVERFDRSFEGLAIRDPHTDAPQFTRVTLEGETGVSFMRDPHTVRLLVRAVDQLGDFDPRALLPSDRMRLGGGQALAGFEPGRFHDIDLAAAKLTYIFPLTRVLEFDLHAETGAVVPELGGLRGDQLETSFGFALRPRRSSGALASIGMDFSRESARLRYSLGGVE